MLFILESRVKRLRLRLSQSHAGLNFSQSQTDCLLRINSCSAISNYLKLFELFLAL